MNLITFLLLLTNIIIVSCVEPHLDEFLEVTNYSYTYTYKQSYLTNYIDIPDQIYGDFYEYDNNSQYNYYSNKNYNNYQYEEYNDNYNYDIYHNDNHYENYDYFFDKLINFIFPYGKMTIPLIYFLFIEHEN